MRLLGRICFFLVFTLLGLIIVIFRVFCYSFVTRFGFFAYLCTRNKLIF